MPDSSNDSLFKRRSVDINGGELTSLVRSADAFICAAGFEARAKQVPLRIHVRRNPLVVRYLDGCTENDRAFAQLEKRFSGIPGYDVCELRLGQPERFEANLMAALRELRNFESGNIVLDISGFLNSAICILVTQIRKLYPTSILTLVYTEASEYFPKYSDYERIKRDAGKDNLNEFPEYLSKRAVSMFIPAIFSGVTLGHYDTCLIAFAGYEPHRTRCAIEATNPTKFVMIFGEPGRKDLKWRLKLSRIMHTKVGNQLTRGERTAPTYDVRINLNLLLEFYDHLYDDHVLCVCPINSKIQAVASALAWERYPDIQLAFPMPVEYLPDRFSKMAGETFVIDLGMSAKAHQFF